MTKNDEIIVCLLIIAVLCCFGMLFSTAPQMGVCLPASGREAVLPKKVSPGGSIRVNYAGVAELEQIPGIGPALAQAIVDERESHGPFHYAEDLEAVKGIGPKTLDGFRDMIDLTEGESGE